MSVDIAYIVSHGFAARMVTQTNLLGLLVKEGKKVALICPDKNDENLQKYCQKEGVELYEFNPRSQFWSAQYVELRKYFLEDIDTNVALKEKHIWATRFSTSKSIVNYLKPRFAYLGFKLTKYFPIIRTWYKSHEEKHLQSVEARNLIEKIDPKILVSTYPVNFPEAMLLKAGNEKKNTTTIIHLLSWDNITCKGHFPQLADKYIAWGPIMRDELIEYYQIPEEKIFMGGVPHFDLHAKTKLESDIPSYLNTKGLDFTKPYLFFGMSSPRFAPGEIDIVEWLASEINKNRFGKDMQLVIRPHPQNVQGFLADVSWLPRLEKLHGERIIIDYPDFVENSNMWLSMEFNDMERLSILLSKSKVCLNSGSTLSIDSLLLDIPVIITAFDGSENFEYWKSSRRLIDYPHLKKFLKINNIAVVHNYEELRRQIEFMSSNPIKENNINLEVANIGYSTSSIIHEYNQIE